MHPTTSDLWRWSAADLTRGIRLRAISSREATRAVLDRCAAVNPRINAVVLLLEQEALAAADAADAAVARGDDLGVLHGVPVTTKCNVDQQGVPTTNGVEAFAELFPPADAPVVANLRRAGAVIFGRTNTPAFSMRWFTDNALHGQTLNPFSAGHTPGGSSGGAAAAVAAGIGPIAHGNDLGGSVRYPAYACGIAGIRPSFGRVPAFAVSAAVERPLSGQLMSTQGPLARQVEDLRLALAAMAQPDIRDPWQMPVPLDLPKPGRRIRVAMCIDPMGRGVHPAVAAAVQQAGRILADAGYVVEEADPPGFAEVVRDWDAWVMGEAQVFMQQGFERLADANARTCYGFMTKYLQTLSAEALMQLAARRATHQRRWAQFFEGRPLLLCPNSAEPPFPQGLDTSSQEGFDRVFAAQGPQLACPLLGLPGVSVPTGLVEGVPMGVQIIAARWRDDLALDAAEVIEAGCPMPTPVEPG